MMLFDLLNQKVELAAHTKPTPRRGLKFLGENCSEGIWDKKKINQCSRMIQMAGELVGRKTWMQEGCGAVSSMSFMLLCGVY